MKKTDSKAVVKTKKVNYRETALNHYGSDLALCAYCGFGVREILEVAHLDQNRENNEIANLALLCPNCHKMHDIGLIPTEVIVLMRDMEKRCNWKLRIKDAGEKAAKTRKANTIKMKKTEAGKKAWATRRKEQSSTS